MHNIHIYMYIMHFTLSFHEAKKSYPLELCKILTTCIARKPLVHLLSEEMLFLMSCTPETNHEGKIDYIEFVEMYYEPAKSIGKGK